ncbi:MAG TPA: alpha/beta hydrolase [Ktedonobacterales bacterium]
MSRPVVFIHGAWMTPKCWDPFLSYFTARGYNCLAPAWPYHDRSVEELNTLPDPRLGRLGLGEIADHFEGIIRALPMPPLIIGHSFGGLVAQVLLDRGLGAAGVALDPAPPRGIIAALYPTTTRSLLRVIITPGGWSKVFHWTQPEFAYAFVHTLPPDAQARAFRDYVVPESGRVFFQNALSALSAHSPARIDFANPRRAPLLIVAGAADHIVPATMVRATWRKYPRDQANAPDFREFPGRTHWLIAQPGWEEVASSVEAWLRAKAPAS